MLSHPFEPIWDAHSRYLVLGTFPSVASRQYGFYYGHPRNRFWKTLSAAYGVAEPISIPEKTAFLFTHNIALWDVLKSCDITASSDSSIKNIIPNDIGALLERSNIEHVLCNGRKAFEIYSKYNKNIPAICMPSTSPANAAWSLEKLIATWKTAMPAQKN